MFNESESEKLLRAESISDQHPWMTNDERQIDSFYRKVIGRLEIDQNLKSRIEWDHYGSGYASYIDAWFYQDSDEFRELAPLGECFVGVAVLFSRLSPFYVLGQGSKAWSEGGGSSYLPCMDFVDVFDLDCTRKLSKTIESFLEKQDLSRVKRVDLENPLSPDYRVPTILSDSPWTEFDALFHWED